jgi:ATP-dependent HslUV protease ATP-binding subunit HslU
MTQKLFTPKKITEYLDTHIIGQKEAKEALSIALYQRQQRKKVTPEMQEEIIPRNILMVGPTGVGKTEMARRLAKITNSPFIKVEATKFTEVGYVGRDVDSIIRDLLDNAVIQIKKLMKEDIMQEAVKNTQNRIVTILVGEHATDETRQHFYQKLIQGDFNDNEIEIDLVENTNHANNMMDIPGMQLGMFNINDLINKTFGNKKTKKVKLKISEAYKNILDEESDKLINEEQIIKNAVNAVEQDGIVFIDEIDKITNKNSAAGHGQVSREGVQRDLLPLIEGTIVNTKHGPISTKHILFIGSGAFHTSKPSDLLPELQGRLPVKVELSPLTEEDMIAILVQTEFNLPKQYKALLAVDDVEVEFEESGIKKIANIAMIMNDKIENLGARRLHSIMEKVMQEVNFNSPDMAYVKVIIDEKYVVNRMQTILALEYDINKFIL